jgi:hypothetical protein
VGEGLVRGRLLDGARPAEGAAVQAAKAHRTTQAGADGAFELRLPAGTWMLGFRRQVAPGAPEAAPSELRVAVAAGAIVDVGTVQLAAPKPAPSAEPDSLP